jgi:predicted RNA-binding Zn-ribbon protein involved in translation (DUF1610 family)
MSHEQSPMFCPDCGGMMNHHAMKVDYGVADAADDATYGGALQEVHTCPDCGHIELRRS